MYRVNARKDSWNLAGVEPARGRHFNFSLIPRGVGGVNLAAKGTSLEEIGALFTGAKVHLFEFWRHMFEFWHLLFEFSNSNKRSKPFFLEGRGGGVGGSPWTWGSFSASVWAKKALPTPCEPIH